MFLLAFISMFWANSCQAYNLLPDEMCGYQTSGECTTALASLHEYCGTTPPSGLDGTDPDKQGAWTLKHVMLLVRHGDENPPAPPKNATRVIHSTHWKELEEDPYPFLANMENINAYEIEKKRIDNTVLRKEAFFHPNASAQLTKRGFMQNIKTGQFLAKRYAPLLKRIISPDQIYVRSARSGRAVQTAASLITGLIPGRIGDTNNSKVKVRFFSQGHHEVMMGVGKHHDICSVIVKSSRAQNQIMKTRNREISNAVSASQTAYCNNEPLFCHFIDGEKRCLNQQTLAVLKSMNDRTMCQIFSGSMGGLQASELKAGPFMQDLKRHLQRAIDTKAENPERLVIYTGHSSILQLALVGLGVYRHICANPPFGSRVTFEVWEKKKDLVPRVLETDKEINETKNFNTGKLAVSRGLKSISKNVVLTTFVRVLYGGKDVTHLIPSCVMRAEPDEIRWDRRNLRGDAIVKLLLCPIDRLFLHFDSGTRFHFDYLPDDCKEAFKKSYARYASEFVDDV